MRRVAVALSLLGAFVLLAVAHAPGAATSPSPQPARPLLGNLSAPAPAAPASSVPVGFQDSVAFSGLTNPTAVRFAPDGRVFVIEKRGLLKVFDSLSDTTPTVVADLHSEVDDYWDRGLLGMALDPSFATTRPYVYLLYTYDAPPGRTAPVWNDTCPTPPGPNTDGCVVSGRLVRVQVSAADQEVGSPQVLIADQWCQQFPSHSVGDLGFGPDGKLYVSGGEGASFTLVDYGQTGGTLGTQTPANPCGDPPAGVGVALTPPSAEGGALRAQSPNRAHGPAVLDGSLLRLDPDTGAGAAGNPGAGSSDPNLRRIIAYGLRNPFRFAFRPQTSELWLGDVGWDDWEEIERLQTPPAAALNFGWPCYEGPSPQPGYQSAGLTICSNLYATPSAVTGPYFDYSHQDDVALGDGCTSTHGSVVSGIGFYGGTSYPALYRGALVFADHSRECIWAMPLGTNGQPDPSRVQPLVNDASNPVDIESGPNGDLYYVDFDGGTIHQLSYNAAGTCAAGTFLAEYHNSVDLSGPAVLRRCESAIDHDWGNGPPGPGVNSDGFSATWSGQFSFAGGSYTFSSTADDGVRVYVDGVSRIDDWHDQAPTTTTATVSLTAGTHTVRVDYYDRTGGALAQMSWQLDAANSAPTAVIDAPSPTLTYAVGDTIAFAGHATDPQDGTLPASALSWTLLIHHCTTPTTCHVHDVQTWSGVSSGSLSAPDHDYPSHLELVLQATDTAGLQSTTSVTLDPKTVDLSFATIPSGLALAVGSSSGATPFTRTVIVGSANSVSAPATQALEGHTYAFASWSDGGAATHTVTAPGTAVGFTATYTDVTPPPAPPPPVLPPLSTQAPALRGVAKQGQLLSVDPGEWSGGAPLSYSYAWLRCAKTGASCVVVAGATGSRYELTAFDVGARIEARVTATNAIGWASAPTTPSAVVQKHVRGTVRVLHRTSAPARPRAPHHRSKRFR